MMFGYHNEEIIKMIHFYQRWSDIVERPEFQAIKAKSDLRFVNEEIERLDKRRQELNEQINRYTS